MNNLPKIVDLLETNLSKLLSKYHHLKEENDQLKQQNINLEVKIKDQQQLLNDFKQEQESFKIANAIVGSKEDKHLTKLKINTLIREIDKCIIQLSE